MAKYAIEAGKGNLSAANVNKIENIHKEKELPAWKYRSQVVDILKDEKLADMLLMHCLTDVPKKQRSCRCWIPLVLLDGGEHREGFEKNGRGQRAADFERHLP